MIARIKSGALVGIDGVPVEIEVDINGGLPRFDIVGLPDTAVQESRVRVKSAIANSDYDFPLRRIHVNLAPADLKKGGPAFDLPLALGILSATGQVNTVREDSFLAVGELSLDGKVRPVNGLLSLVLAAREIGARDVLVPKANAREATLVREVNVYGISNLREAAAFLEGEGPLVERFEGGCPGEKRKEPEVDLSEIRGQLGAKRAVEVAAAGGHHLLMIGPPGAGKTMLARAFTGVMSPLDFESAVEVTRIHSAAGKVRPGSGLITFRPFRSPHHSISLAGMVGGGSPLPRPGEISLAHEGVLFLDEVTQFRKDVLEALRTPLEDAEVSIIRSMISVTFPSRFTLVASMNPCRCGYLGDRKRECVCPPGDIERYRNRLSGPLVDRIDIQVEVPRLERDEMMGEVPGEPSSAVLERVERTRDIQRQRFDESDISCNGQMRPGDIKKYCRLVPETREFIGRALESLGLSARAYHRVLRVARTIADLAGSDGLEVAHLAEALQYRAMERRIW